MITNWMSIKDAKTKWEGDPVEFTLAVSVLNAAISQSDVAVLLTSPPYSINERPPGWGIREVWSSNRFMLAYGIVEWPAYAEVRIYDSTFDVYVANVAKRADRLQKELEEIRGAYGQIGHNGPPGPIDLPVSRKDIAGSLDALKSVQAVLASPEPAKSFLQNIAKRLRSVAARTARWLGRHISEGFGKQIGGMVSLEVVHEIVVHLNELADFIVRHL